MRKMLKILLIILMICLIGVGAVFMLRPSPSLDGVTSPNPAYAPYVLGYKIDFSADGNGNKFISAATGWGAQGANHRLLVAPHAEINLYVADIADDTVRLEFKARGIFNPDAWAQPVTLYANGVLITTWRLKTKNVYSVYIPKSLMPDGLLRLRFVPSNPYAAPGAKTPLFAEVYGLSIHKIYGVQTKKRISRWFQNKLSDIVSKDSYTTPDINSDTLRQKA